MVGAWRGLKACPVTGDSGAHTTTLNGQWAVAVSSGGGAGETGHQTDNAAVRNRSTSKRCETNTKRRRCDAMRCGAVQCEAKRQRTGAELLSGAPVRWFVSAYKESGEMQRIATDCNAIG